MISVVVPTMWRFEPFTDFLENIARLSCVDDIIVINNDRTRTPNHPVLEHPKVKMLDFGTNIYVNPAWNIGVAASKNNKVCILNDDLIFDLRLFLKVDQFLTDDMGVIGLSEGLAEYNQTPFTNGVINFEPFTNQNCWGFGELMFVNKSHWVDIPAGLEIGFGDVFIFEQLLFRGYTNWFITNMKFYHKGSTTQKEVPRPEAEQRLAREQAIYNQIRPYLINQTHRRSSV